LAIYSFLVLPESDVSVTGTRVVDGMTVPKTLDGLDQGDGSHLVGEFITINSKNYVEVLVDDNGSETNFADNEGGQNLGADVTIDGVDYTSGTRVEAEYQFVLVDDATNTEYQVIAFNVNDSSPSYATIEGLAFVDAVPPTGVALRVDRASEGPSNGGPNALDESRIVPCFCADTLIETAHGPRMVQELAEGDLICRADGSLTPLRRVFEAKVGVATLLAAPQMRPVRIRAGALGRGLPRRDLRVSRQHRMVMSSKIAERMFGCPNVLIPAIKLTALPGIDVENPSAQVRYFHMLFDQHEVILAEGAPTESLFIGPEALQAISPEARAEILALFPQVAEPGFAPEPAMPIPTGRLQKKAVARHLQNGQPVLMGGN